MESCSICLLWLAKVTPHNVLKVYPCCSLCQNSLPFYGWIILPCVHLPHLDYPFILPQTLGLLHFLAIVNNAAISIDVQISLSDPAFNSFGSISRRELLDCMIILSLTVFEEPPYSFLYWLHHLTFPPSVQNGSNVSLSFASLVIFPWRAGEDSTHVSLHITSKDLTLL